MRERSGEICGFLFVHRLLSKPLLDATLLHGEDHGAAGYRRVIGSGNDRSTGLYTLIRKAFRVEPVIFGWT